VVGKDLRKCRAAFSRNGFTEELNRFLLLGFKERGEKDQQAKEKEKSIHLN